MQQTPVHTVHAGSGPIVLLLSTAYPDGVKKKFPEKFSFPAFGGASISFVLSWES